MVAVVAAARDGRRRSRVGPGLPPLCGPCPCWVWRHGWCINGAEHWHAPALIPRNARGPSTTLIHHLVVELLPEKRADTVGQPPGAEICVSNMPSKKAKKLRKPPQETVRLEL